MKEHQAESGNSQPTHHDAEAEDHEIPDMEEPLPPPQLSPHPHWRAPLMTRIMSVIFVLGCLVLVVVCGMAMMATDGFNRLLLGLTTVFPALVMVAAFLRMLSVWTRSLQFEGQRFNHHQFLKNYEVPLTQLKRIEVRNGPLGPETVRIRWNGTPFYIDADGLDDFEGFFSHLRAVSSAPLEVVTAFEPVE